MDFWLVAAVAGAGYLSKYWKSISQENKLSLLSSREPNFPELNSTGCPLRGLTNRPRQRSNVASEELRGEDDFSFTVLNLQSGLSVGNGELEEYESGNMLPPGLDNGVKMNRSSLRTKMSHARSVKPVNSLESCLMAQLYKERGEAKEYVFSSVASPATMNMRPLFVTDGSRVISKSRQISCTIKESEISEEAKYVHGVPLLAKIGSVDSPAKAKARKTGNGEKGKAMIDGKEFNPLEGSLEGMSLLCLGISIGIMASLMTNKREVDELKDSLKHTENLVIDLQEELEMKDSLTVKELSNENNDTTSDGFVSEKASEFLPDELNVGSSKKEEESSESISKIEAELEAELERLGLNFNASNLERRSADVDEIDPEFGVHFSQGELRIDMLGIEDVAESERDKHGASTSTTPDTAKNAVSPRELSLRLHEVIQSRLEGRVNELEIALQNSHRKIRVMESGVKNWGAQSNGRQLGFESPIAIEPAKSVPKPEPEPLVVDLYGDALEAYNEAREELMKLSDSDEEDSPQRIYEDIHSSESSHHGGVFRSLDDGITFESGQNVEIPEEKSVGELFPGSLGMRGEHISLVLGSNDSTNSRDEVSDCDDEVERELIKQIVERTKKGSSVVINAQRLLSSMQEN